MNMSFINLLASSAAGALMLSTGALGRSILQGETAAAPQAESGTGCTVIATGYSETKNQKQLASAGLLSQLSIARSMPHQMKAYPWFAQRK
jgi:hypothetical protein